MKFSDREKYILIITAALVTAALSYNFIVEPFFKKCAGINNEIIIKQAAFKKGVRLLEKRDAIITDYNNYAASVKDVSKLLSYIEQQGLSLGIKIVNIKPLPAVQKELYKEHVIELEIEGAFLYINRFVSELIKPPALITVKKFELRTAPGETSYLKATLILSKLVI